MMRVPMSSFLGTSYPFRAISLSVRVPTPWFLEMRHVLGRRVDRVKVGCIAVALAGVINARSGDHFAICIDFQK